MHTALRTPKNQPPLAHTTTNNTQQKKHKTPSPCSPQAAGFQRLQFYRWVRSSYVARSITIIATRRCTFYWRHYLFLYLLTIILCAAAQCAHWLKVRFQIYILCFFCAAALKWRGLTPAIWQYLIWQCCWRTHLVLAWFWTGGGGAPRSQCFQEGRGRFSCFLRSVINNSKHLGKKS